MVEVPGLGNILMIDTTDEYTSIGDIPAALSGKGAMVMTDQDAVALILPDDRAENHEVSRILDAVVLDDGQVAMQLTTRRIGGPASAARYSYSSSASDYRTRTEKNVKRLWVDSSFEELSVEAESPTGEFTQTMRCKVSPTPGSSGHRWIRLFPMALDDLRRVSLRRREQPVRYGHPLTLNYRTVVKGFLPETALPVAHESEGAGWAIRSSYKREGDELHAEWHMTLSRREFEPDSFTELKKFWSSAQKSVGALIRIP